MKQLLTKQINIEVNMKVELMYKVQIEIKTKNKKSI